MLPIFVWAGLTIFISGLLFILISMFKLTETSRLFSVPYTSSSKAEILQLKRKIGSQQERLEATKAALDEEKESFSALTSFLREKEAEIAGKTRIAEEAKEGLTRSIDEKSRLEEMVASFKNELSGANDSIPIKIEEAKIPLKEEIDKLKEDVLKSENEGSDLQKENAILRDNLALAKDETVVLKREFELIDEKHLVREALIKELSQNIDMATNDLRVVRDENTDFVQEITLLKKELEAFEENGKIKDSIVDELTHKRELALKEHALTKEECVSLKGRISSLEATLAVTRDSIPDKVHQAKAVLQKVIDMLKEERTELLTQKLERDQALASYRRENEALRADLDKVEKRIRDNEIEFDNLNERFSVVAEDLVAAKDSAAPLREELKISYDVKTSLERQVRKLDKIISSTESEIGFLKRELQNTQAGHKPLMEGLKEKDSTIEYLTDKVATLAEGLTKTERQKNLLEEKIDSLREDLMSVTESIPVKIKHARKDLQEELDTVKVDHLELITQKSEHEKQLRIYEHENVLLRQTLKDIKSEKSKLKNLLGDIADNTEIGSEMTED